MVHGSIKLVAYPTLKSRKAPSVKASNIRGAVMANAIRGAQNRQPLGAFECTLFFVSAIIPFAIPRAAYRRINTVAISSW